MKEIYDYPKYYEIAFSFRDIENEVNVFEKAINDYSKIPVKKMLELASGNSPHINELLQRGYSYYGIDLNEEMLRFSSEKSGKSSKAHFINANIADFELPEKVDFAYIMLGSLYLNNKENVLSHFRAVADNLKSGGLYFLDWVINFEPLNNYDEEWEMEEGNIYIKTEIKGNYVDSLNQVINEKVTLKINDNGYYFEVSHTAQKRIIFPQEFLLLIELLDDFEFIGWWNNWDLRKPLKANQKISRPITIIRRK